jgi:hypothetical protein
MRPLLCEFTRPLPSSAAAAITPLQRLGFPPHLLHVKRVIGHLLGKLWSLLCEVLESSIIRQTLLGAEAVQLRVSGVGEAVALEGCVGGGLLLELGEGVGAG